MTSNDPTAYGATGWRVTSQTETQDRAADGQFVDGWRVYFTTPSGTVGSVFISAMQYTPEVVRAAINAKVLTIEAVNGLQG